MKSSLVVSIWAMLFFLAGFYGCSSENRESEEARIQMEAEPVERIYADASPRSPRQSIDDANEDISSSRQSAITRTVEQSCPAIVGINVTETHKVEYRHPFYNDPFFQRFFGHRSKPRYREYQVKGLGSGFIISPDGYILTNHHVAGNASKIVITMTNGERYDAKIIGSDYVSDVALLKIDAEGLPYLKLGNSDNLIVGEWVIAFGNPFGLFDINAKPTVTVGVVSNSGIDFTQENRVYRNMIQTDAAISSGNSGGPLINALGEVIGMNTVIFSTAQSRDGAGSIGIGFSIPINRVKKVIDLLKRDKIINRDFFLGIEVGTINERIARYFGLDDTDGVVIVNMYRNSIAEKAGLEPGDIIVEINNNKVENEDDYKIITNDAYVGQTLKFKILRDNKTKSFNLKLTALQRKR